MKVLLSTAEMAALAGLDRVKVNVYESREVLPTCVCGREYPGRRVVDDDGHPAAPKRRRPALDAVILTANEMLVASSGINRELSAQVLSTLQPFSSGFATAQRAAWWHENWLHLLMSKPAIQLWVGGVLGARNYVEDRPSHNGSRLLEVRRGTLAQIIEDLPEKDHHGVRQWNEHLVMTSISNAFQVVLERAATLDIELPDRHKADGWHWWKRG